MKMGENRSVLRLIHDIYTFKCLFNDYTKTYYSIVNYTISYYMFYIYIYVLHTV